MLTDFGQPETVGIAEPLRFHRVAMAFHMYGDPAKQLPLDARERAATITAQPGGPPTVMDEFGASVTDTSGTQATVGVAESEDLSWSYWSALQAHDPTGGPDEGLIDQQTRRPYPALARTLAIPYAFASDGTPGRQSFVAGVYRYTYKVAHTIKAPTQIVVPRDAYPRGYRVHVRGATVISASDGQLLELQAAPSARTVSVTVTARG